MADPPRPDADGPYEEQGPPTAEFNKKMLGFFSAVSPAQDPNVAIEQLERELASADPASPAAPTPPDPSAPRVVAPLPQATSASLIPPSSAPRSSRAAPVLLGLLVLAVAAAVGAFFLTR